MHPGDPVWACTGSLALYGSSTGPSTGPNTRFYSQIPGFTAKYPVLQPNTGFTAKYRFYSRNHVKTGPKSRQNGSGNTAKNTANSAKIGKFGKKSANSAKSSKISVIWPGTKDVAAQGARISEMCRKLLLFDTFLIRVPVSARGNHVF